MNSGSMPATPHSVIKSVLGSICGRESEQLTRSTIGGLNETYRADFANDPPAIVRIARRPEPWFVDEGHAISLAREVGVPVPEVLGVEQVRHDDELLSFSVLSLIPGRSLQDLLGELPGSQIERLVVDSGELLARLHSARTDRGLRHDVHPPSEQVAERAAQAAGDVCGPDAADIVRRGVDRLQTLQPARSSALLPLAHGDWLPKHMMVHDGKIVGVIDWEFTGPAPPAFDLAHWQVAAGPQLQDRSDLLRRGYARVANPDLADAGLVSAYVITFALDVLGWQKPASPGRIERCVDLIADQVV